MPVPAHAWNSHISAPIIHAGFSVKITLEIVNHAPFEPKVRPGVTRLCQLIIEEIKGVPKRAGSALVAKQSSAGNAAEEEESGGKRFVTRDFSAMPFPRTSPTA